MDDKKKDEYVPCPVDTESKSTKKEMSPNEVFEKICNLVEMVFGNESETEDEYVDIEVGVKNLQAVFYLLMRDHVTVGTMNQVLKDLLVNQEERGHGFQFTDGFLEAKAESLVKMLFRGSYCVHEVDVSYEM